MMQRGDFLLSALQKSTHKTRNFVNLRIPPDSAPDTSMRNEDLVEDVKENPKTHTPPGRRSLFRSTVCTAAALVPEFCVGYTH